MINPMKLMKMKSAWDTFNRNHPKFAPFLSAVSRNAIEEGSIIEVKVITKQGETYNTNIKVTQSDLDLFHDLKDMAQ